MPDFYSDERIPDFVVCQLTQCWLDGNVPIVDQCASGTAALELHAPWLPSSTKFEDVARIPNGKSYAPYLSEIMMNPDQEFADPVFDWASQPMAPVWSTVFAPNLEHPSATRPQQPAISGEFNAMFHRLTYKEGDKTRLSEAQRAILKRFVAVVGGDVLANSRLCSRVRVAAGGRFRTQRGPQICQWHGGTCSDDSGHVRSWLADGNWQRRQPSRMGRVLLAASRVPWISFWLCRLEFSLVPQAWRVCRDGIGLLVGTSN